MRLPMSTSSEYITYNRHSDYGGRCLESPTRAFRSLLLPLPGAVKRALCVIDGL